MYMLAVLLKSLEGGGGGGGGGVVLQNIQCMPWLKNLQSNFIEICIRRMASIKGGSFSTYTEKGLTPS